MTDTNAPEVLISLQANAGRRWMAVGCIAAVGVLLLYLLVVRPPAHWGYQLLLLGVGCGALILANALRQATAQVLELTRDELRLADGTVLTRIDQIDRIDRGTFAFKPTNGFLVICSQGAARSWGPGLWWRLGRYLGIGGVTPPAQSKAMAEILAGMIAER